MEVGGASSTARAGVGPRISRRTVLVASLAAAAAACDAIRRGSDGTSSSSSSGLSQLSSDLGSHAPRDLFWWFYQEMLSKLGPTAEEFCGASNCSIHNGHGDDWDLERLLRQLDGGWVLRAADGDSDAGSSRQLRHLTATWLRALAEILHTYSYFGHTSASPPGNFFCVMDRRYWEEGSKPDQLKFTLFAGAAISKLLPFVDSLVAPPPGTAPVNGALPAEKLQALIQVRGALSRIRSMAELCSASSAEVTRVQGHLFSLLSAKLAKLDEAVWNTMEEIRARVLSSTDDDDDDDGDSNSWATHSTLHGSSDIHKMTRSVISYINLVETDYGLVHRIVYEAAKLRKCVPAIGNISTLASLKLEMVSCLEERLDKESQSFQDQSLRFLFLMNNLYFVCQQFHPMFDMKFHMPVLTGKIDDYIQRYLQVSWAPVLSCLHTPTPLCLGRHSPLPKFEFEIHKIYSTQKLWKVPDPELRKRLRKAIIEKVTSGFTNYLEDNNVTTPRLTPQDLEEMLQELFEG